MIVLILEKVPESLRGQLTRWLLEPKTGVFVGHVSTIVREKLWELVITQLRPKSGAFLIYNTPNEQGFQIQMRGNTTRRLITRDGLQLIQRDHPNANTAFKKLSASLSSFRSSQYAKTIDLPDVQV